MTFRTHAVSFMMVLFVQPALLFAQEESSLDVRLFRHINSQQAEQDGIIEFIDDSSFPLFIVVPAGLIVYGSLQNDNSTGETGILVAASQLLAFGGTEVGKAIIDRPRPFEVLRDVKLKHRESAIGSSFPSGHTSQAFAIATMLSFRTKPAVYIPAFLWAAAVGYGRMYVGVHYPTDVLGGVAVGVFASVLAEYLRQESLRTSGTRTDGGRFWWYSMSSSTPLVSISIPFR